MLHTILLLLCIPGTTQEARLTGHVWAGNEATLANAVVTVTELNTGNRHMVLSNREGGFVLASMTGGEYRVEAVKPGYRMPEILYVRLEPGQSRALHVRLDPADEAQTVAVEARCESFCGGSFVPDLDFPTF